MIQTERHIAVVANNEDPESRGRIQVRSASLLGNDETVLSNWVEPCFDWGFFVVPDIGEQVEIEIVSGSSTDEVPGQAFLETPDYRYRGKRFYSTDTPISAFFTESNYGKRRGFATPGGHVFMFDDTEGSRKINLAWHSGDNTYAMFSIDEDGSIILANVSGSLLYLNAANEELALIDQHGNSFASDSDGIKIIDKNSNIIKTKDDDMQLLAQNSMVVSGKAAQLDAGDALVGQLVAGVGSKASLNALSMKLGLAATESIIKGTTYLAALNTFLVALDTFVKTISPPPSGLADFQAAIVTFQAAIAAAPSTKSFTE